MRTFVLSIAGRWMLYIAALLCMPVGAQEANLDALSLEELSNLPVEQAAASKERSVARAQFVLTQDDIRRAGATSIPQALRLVPGLQVAQVDGSRYAISARGFNSRMSNRILVLIDGRSLYTPLTGGVFWNVQDTMIEEVDRIEVLLGPGGAVWGANAFNGVINIITKRASQTGGVVVSTEFSTDASKMAAARIGDAVGDVKWRAFAKYSDGDANQNEDGATINDDWRQARVGGRTEINLSERTRLQLNFEAFTNESGATLYDTNEWVSAFTLPWPATRTQNIDERLEGGFAGAHIVHDLDGGGSFRVDASMQQYDMDSVLMQSDGTNGELNLAFDSGVFGPHRITTGLMGRASKDVLSQRSQWHIDRPEISTWRAGAFAQDELAFFDERLLFTAGAKLEYSELTGSDLMPSLRASYSFAPRSNVWAAASRGVRAPALTEHYGRLGGGPALAPFSAANPGPLPVRVALWGDADMQPEVVDGYELGIRHEFASSFSTDLALYYNEYEGLRGAGRILPLTCEPSGTPASQNPLCVLSSTHLLVPIEITNTYDTTAFGGELVVTYSPAANWQLIGSYARIGHRRQDVDLPMLNGSADDGVMGGFDSKHQWSLRSSVALGRRWDFDAQLRYVDELRRGCVPSYVEMNLRAAWRPAAHVELAITGSNLLHDAHQEFSSDFGEIAPVWIERRVSMQARWLY